MNINFNEFINDFKDKLSQVFQSDADAKSLSLERGLPRDIWNSLMETQPLAVAIPVNYGGRGVSVRESLSVLSATAYESLPLSLTFGINIGLFLQPLAKYGDQIVQKSIFYKFLHEKAMGGLMITEPDHGSDALNMKTQFNKIKEGFKLQGLKHWQGLTGMADYWIVAARKKLKNSLSRDISFFVTDNKQADQEIQVEEFYNNIGLRMIPYGLNNIDITVPEAQQLQPESTGIKMMLDILHRSRMQFPGMGLGFIKRMLDESIRHCSTRKVGRKMLIELDSVRFRISRIQAYYTLCSGMCARSASTSDLENDLSGITIEANSVKALITDMMQESAQICAQLAGANGYKMDHIAGRGIIDSRPFQIFEGPNEMLYTQIADSILKAMGRAKEKNLLEFLRKSPHCDRVIEGFKEDLNFQPGDNLPQRKHVILGKIIARLVSLQYVHMLLDEGFREDLYLNCHMNVEMEIKKLLSSFYACNSAEPILDYENQSDWMDFIQKGEA